MTLRLVPLSLAPHSALWQVLRSDQRRDMLGRALQLGLVLVWLQAVQWGGGMPPLLGAHWKGDMKPGTARSWPPKGIVFRRRLPIIGVDISCGRGTISRD